MKKKKKAQKKKEYTNRSGREGLYKQAAFYDYNLN